MRKKLIVIILLLTLVIIHFTYPKNAEPKLLQIGIIDCSHQETSISNSLLPILSQTLNDYCKEHNADLTVELTRSTIDDWNEIPTKLLKLREKNVNIFVGPTWSSQCETWLSYANKNNITDFVMISPGSNSLMINTFDKKYDNFFRIAPNELSETKAIAALINNLNITKLIIIRDNEIRARTYSDDLKERLVQHDCVVIMEYMYETMTLKEDYDRFVEEIHEYLETVGPREMDAIGIQFIGQSEICEIIMEIDKDPLLRNISMVGTTSTTDMIECFDNYSLPVGITLYSPKEALNPYISSMDISMKLLSEDIHIDYTTSAKIDACWLLVKSFVEESKQDVASIRKSLYSVSINHVGYTGNCAFDDFGDRLYVDYIFLLRGERGVGEGSEFARFYSTNRTITFR